MFLFFFFLLSFEIKEPKKKWGEGKTKGGREKEGVSLLGVYVMDRLHCRRWNFSFLVPSTLFNWRDIRYSDTWGKPFYALVGLDVVSRFESKCWVDLRLEALLCEF